MRPARIALAVLAAGLAAGTALAQDADWFPLHSDAKVTVTAHAPFSAAAPKGQLWVHAEYARKAKLQGFSYASERYLAQVYCDTGLIFRTNWELFSRPGLAGKSKAYAPKEDMAWAITPDTVDDWVARAACRKP